MAWASETPGVSTPPTVVNAPNLITSLRLNGFAITDLLAQSDYRQTSKPATTAAGSRCARGYRSRSVLPFHCSVGMCCALGGTGFSRVSAEPLTTHGGRPMMTIVTQVTLREGAEPDWDS